MSKTQGEFSWNEKKGNPRVKNKFIIFIILLILFILWYILYNTYLLNTVDRNSYVVLVKWNAKLNESLLVKDIKNKLFVWDTVRTIWETSLAVLEWWDGSVTRLWWNSDVKIDELYVSKDISEINIWFKILSGKSWSNIISFLWEWSYFKEEFRDSVAAVRWTIFNLDLSKDYLIVQDHKLNLLTPNWEELLIEQNSPINIKSFSFIQLEEFIRKIKDVEWEKLNIQNDSQLLAWLKQQIQDNLDELIEFRNLDIKDSIASIRDKEKVYKRLLSDYQKLNFVDSQDSELFKLKLELKDILLKIASDKNKEKLINTTLYDFQDIVDNNNYENIGSVLDILSENKEFIPEIDFKKYFKNGIMSEELQNILKSEWDKLKIIFWETFNKTMLNPLDSVKKLEEKGTQLINNALDSWLEKINNLID